TVSRGELVTEGDLTALGTSVPARAVSSLLAVARIRVASHAEVSALLAHLHRQADRPGTDGVRLVDEIIPQVSEIAQGLWVAYQPVLSAVIASFADETSKEDA